MNEIVVRKALFTRTVPPTELPLYSPVQRLAVVGAAVGARG